MTGAGDPFEPLHDEVLRNIAASGVVRTFPRNTVLINEGDVGDALYVILSGRVKVYSSNEAGREFVIDFHSAGEYVGEMTLDRAQFRDFILAHPDFAMHLIDRLIHRLRVTTGNLKSLALSDVYGRLVRLLNTLAHEVDGKFVVPEKLTQQDIADRVGASRDMIGKLMKDLVAGGYLAIEDRTIMMLRKLPTGW